MQQLSREELLFALEIIRRKKHGEPIVIPKEPKPIEPNYDLKTARTLNQFLSRLERGLRQRRGCRKVVTTEMLNALAMYFEGASYEEIERATGVEQWKIYDLLKFFSISNRSILDGGAREELANLFRFFGRGDRRLTRSEVVALRNKVAEILDGRKRITLKEYYAELREKIVEDLKKGTMTNREVARKYRVTEDCVWKIAKEYGLKALGNHPRVKVGDLEKLKAYYEGAMARRLGSRPYYLLKYFELPKRGEASAEVKAKIVSVLDGYLGRSKDYVLSYSEFLELKERLRRILGGDSGGVNI